MDLGPAELEVYPTSNSISHGEQAGKDSERIFTKPFLNVLVSGSVMCLVYCAFFPGGGLLDVVITDAGNLDSSVGYAGQALTYISSLGTSLVAPFVIKLAGPRWTLAIGALFYTGMYVGMIFLKAWTIYLGSIISGLGMGTLWVIALKIVTDNSTERTLQRNNSIWWCIYISSMVIGNLANYFYLGSLTHIDSRTRTMVYLGCCILTVLGLLVGLFGYRHVTTEGELESQLEDSEELLCNKSIDAHSASKSLDLAADNRAPSGVFEKLAASLDRYRVTLLRKEVGFILTLLMYNGMTLSFYTMTFQTCIGNTFTERSLISLMALVFGVTEVCGAVVFERLAEKVSNQTVAVVLYLLAITSFFLVFLMFPQEATHADVTKDLSFVAPHQGVVLLIACLLAFADAGFNIMATSCLGLLFQADSDVGFMLFNAVMSLSAGTVFLASSALSLYVLLAVEVALCTAATVCIVLGVFDVPVYVSVHDPSV